MTATSSEWLLRYASHLGFRSADTPLFGASVGSLDPVAHVNFAADLGFAGVQFALAASAAREQCEAFGRAIEQRGIEAGCMIYAPREAMVQPLWGKSGREQRDLLMARLQGAFDVAGRIRTRYVAILSGCDPRAPRAYQQIAMAENLKWAADLAEKAGVILLLEPTNIRALPNMLLTRIAEGHAIVQMVDNPHVRLIFDTGHVQIMDGDLLENLDGVWSSVAMIQIADNPGRTEPGTGEINLANVLGELVRRNFKGLVELEHFWATPGKRSEQDGIDWLRATEAAIVARRPARANA